MKKILLIILMLSLFVATPVLAYAYSAAITVTESDDISYTQLPIIVGINNTFLADNNYISTSGLDTRVLEASDTLPHMLASDRTLFVSDIDANTQSNFNYTLGNDVLENFYAIVGYGGYLTVSDNNETLELGDSFTIEIKGYVRTTFGDYTNRNLIYKADAFRLHVSDAGEITATITGTPDVSVVANNVETGVRIIKVTGDGTYFKIFIDGSEKDSVGVISVTNTDDDWRMLENNVMPYMEYLRVEVG